MATLVIAVSKLTCGLSVTAKDYMFALHVSSDIFNEDEQSEGGSMNNERYIQQVHDEDENTNDEAGVEGFHVNKETCAEQVVDKEHIDNSRDGDRYERKGVDAKSVAVIWWM